MYTVVYKKGFRDLKDKEIDSKGYLYTFGKEYPRLGFEVSKKRLLELSSSNNKIGEILISLVDEKSVQKPADKETPADGETPADKETPADGETPAGNQSSVTIDDELNPDGSEKENDAPKE